MQQGYFQGQTAGGSKRERTRSALLDATVSVVAAKGMEAAKILDITEAAGLANGTFYNYFDDKESILREAAYGIALAVGRQLDEEMSGIGDAGRRVVTATTRFIEIVVREPDWAHVLLGSAEVMPEMRKDIYRYLRSDIELGVEQGKFDVEVTGFLLDQVASLIGVSIRTQISTGPNAALTRQTCESILRLLGMSPAKARKLAATG
ncbi:TetR/AcrR family transcriptional regulator [Parvibaculum sp.]|uniref:TetR/AcrR family transcriptional regulator n=1 Tax=Parvibaculum sp. TaxID=2024848 RepID=UPI001B280C34|nr:TetR/AcrR family transcriptional regulator [Parvibaculum sp.]MBO6666477.1 TetR/AcrR family transcriptional regulator [Parvibaculum sp.]MBO6690928.1 TetR/AcrR family transcriptional regulator [Parvibaculum sp.]MBO6713098.1 TetR/AcrR family transcriptional regulator [Parvibaculum sp.]